MQPRGTSAERMLVLIFLLSTFLVPLIVVELYPFSASSMFAHTPNSVCLYELQDPLGEPLDPWQFGVGLNQPHDPPVRSLGRDGYGRQFLQSPAGYDKEFDRGLVEERLIPKMKRLSLASIEVTGRRYEVVEGTVKQVEVRNWIVQNPNYYR